MTSSSRSHALGLYTALLNKDPPRGERRELIAHISTCVASLTSLFDAILGVTHAENVHLHAKPVSFPLQRAIDQVLIQLRPTAEAKGLRLHTVKCSLWVRADPSVVERHPWQPAVQRHPLSTERGRILVGVRRRAGGKHCMLLVADTGIGLSAHDQPRIFDDFFQVNNPDRTRDKGYGLGLSTVHRLCSALSYDIQVRSQVGRGSVFTVSLPLDAPASQPDEQLPEQLDALGAGLNVLFVEDNPLVRDAMQRMLRDWGVRVSVCGCGDEAMTVLSQELDRHWHVLLDHQLADNETGLQVADRIRSVIGDSPVISLITGEDDAAIDAAAAARGITVLRKPLKPIRLRALLESRHAHPGGDH